MTLYEALRRLIEELDELGVPYCMVGGLAVTVLVEPRFTRDLDMAVSVPDDAAAEAVLMALHGRGYSTYSTVEHLRTGRLATARMWSPGGEDRVAVDLIFASSGIEDLLCERACPVEVLPRVRLPVVSIGHLVALKLLSVSAERPKDAQDLVALRSVATPSDHADALHAIQRIVSLGTNRNRALEGLLADWWEGRSRTR